MNKGKEDRRVKYTRMVLRESLIELLEKHDISHITVTAICRLADINRNTFYSHYNSPADLLSEMEEEVIDEVLTAIKDSNSTQEILLSLCRKLYSMREMNKVVYLKRGNRKFMQTLFKITRESRVKEWHQMAPHRSLEDVNMMFSFTQGGVMMIIDEWINSGYIAPPEEIATKISGLIIAILGYVKSTD